MAEITKCEKHKELTEKLHSIYREKNEAYGDSFGITFQELGLISGITRMSDKWHRIKALALGAENKVLDERLEDTLLDLANYCLLTYIELEVLNGRL